MERLPDIHSRGPNAGGSYCREAYRTQWKLIPDVPVEFRRVCGALRTARDEN